MTAPSRQICFAAMADDGIRAESSSGGAFTIFARNILARGGVVCGAAFDERFRCRYEIVRDEASLARLRGSKYVRAALPQSLFANLRAALESGVPALFSGTPCQVSAIKRMFANFADSLFTVDLICAGCPGQDLFDRYLDDNWGRANVAKYEFRSKARGWRHHHYLLHVVLKDGSEVWREKGEDEYMTAMSSGLGLSAGCLNCPFCSMDRPGDLTIGDFWRVPEDMDDGKGTSAILINTEKGRGLFESVRPAFAKTAEYPPSCIEERQARLRTPPTPAAGRALFLKCIASGMSVKDSVAKALADVGRNVAVLNFHWETVNFGAVLTAYALNRGLRAMGFEVRNIDFKPNLPRVQRKPSNAKFDEFRRQYIPMTQRVESAGALKSLNARFGSFVVGSDQVWNPDLTGWFRDVYFLMFAEPGKRLVSAAASFGIDPLLAFGRGLLGKTMRAFDALGVRECSAAERLSALGLSARPVADPVFLLGKEDWQALAGRGKAPCGENDVVWYAVNPYGRRGLSEFFRMRAAEVAGRLRQLDASIGIEDWLAAVANAPLVLTDSFHAVCFAIIFERPFAVLASQGAKSGRMRGLLEALGLADRLYESPDDMPSVDELRRPMDFMPARRKIDEMRGELAAFLREALECPVSDCPARVSALRRAVRALLVREILLLLRRWGRTMLHAAKMAAKLAIGKNIAHDLESLRRRNEELCGRKGAIRRMRGYLRSLGRWSR